LIKIRDVKERKLSFLKIRKKFFSYVISILFKKASKNLPPEKEGIRFVSKIQLKDYYDYDIGFKISPDPLIW
jgi:hypothetical protein